MEIFIPLYQILNILFSLKIERKHDKMIVKEITIDELQLFKNVKVSGIRIEVSQN